MAMSYATERVDGRNECSAGRRTLYAALVLSMCQSGLAAAALRVDADAGAGAYAAGDQYTGTADVAHAEAWAYQANDGDGGSAADAGPGKACPSGGLSCVTSISGGPAIGVAAAEARGDTGSLRVLAVADEGATQAGSFAMLSDSISLRGADHRLRIELDIESVAGTEGGSAEFSFQLWQGRFEVPLQGDEQRMILASFEAYDDGSMVGGYYEVHRQAAGAGMSPYIEDLELLDSGYGIPGRYVFEFDFDLICPSFGGVNSCTGPGGGVDVDFTAVLDVSVDVDGEGRASVKADRSVYLLFAGPYVSASGYQYASPVPLPAAGWLFGASLLVTGRLWRRVGGSTRSS